MRTTRGGLLFGAGLVAVAVLALGVRLHDPLSDPVIGAEDPFSHIVITKELMRRGHIAGPESLNGPLYPPGLHLLVGPVWTLSGFELYDVARFGPPLLGVMAVVGVVVLLQRHVGAAGALAAGLLLATMPEHVFRTNLLFPTALDLALIPAYLIALERAAAGHRAGLAFLALAGAAIAVAHPWALMLLAPIAVLFVLLRVAYPPADQPLDRRGALGGAALAVAMGGAAYLWWKDAPFIGIEREFSSKTASFIPTAAEHMGLPTAALVTILVAFVGLLAAMAWAWWRRPAWRAWTGGAAGLALAAAVVVLVARLPEMPPGVDYRHMLGVPAIVLGLAGLAVAPARRSAAGDLGLAIVAVTFPFTAIDFFDSIYWSHRTVAYMIPGLALLAGVAVGAAVDALDAALPRLMRARVPLGRAAAAGVALALVAVAALPAAQSTYRWYRYDTPEEFAVVEEAAAIMARDPDAVVIAGAWQANLFVRAMGDETRGVWAPDAYKDPATLDALVERLRSEGRHPYLLVDSDTREDLGLEPEGLGFLGGRGEVVASCCGESSALVDMGRA